jgi:hypothetical protein
MKHLLRRYGPFIAIVVVVAVVVVVVVASSGGGSKPTGVSAAAQGAPQPAQAQDCARQALLGSLATCKPGFAGDNGGATYAHGVAKDAVTIDYLNPPVAPLVQQVLIANGLSTSTDDLVHLLKVYEQFFNQNFQTYGRHVNVKVYSSKIDPNSDPAGTRADAVALDQEEHSFLSMGSNTADFLDEASRRGLVSLGGNQFPSSFYTDHSPYVFGLLPTADATNAHIAEYITKRLGKTSTADFAGAGTKGKPRRYGIVFPATGADGAPSSYASTGDDLYKRLTEAGVDTVKPIGYSSDVNTATQQSTSIVRQLADAGTTTVICLCDLLSPRFLTSVASQQNYFPEWFESGYLLQDTDFAGRLYDQSEWSHAFGISTLPVQNTTGGNDPNSPLVKAWKTVEPNTDPPNGAAVPFSYLLVAFSGIEAAGPRLDANSFAQGLFNTKLVAHDPTQLTYSYSTSDYGGVDDAQAIWWDPEAVAPGDQKKGHWQSVDGGYRYLPGQWPATPPHSFDPACLPAGSCGGKTF